MKLFIVSSFFVLLSAGIFADPIKDIPSVTSGFSKCLDADSISCLQLTVRIILFKKKIFRK